MAIAAKTKKKPAAHAKKRQAQHHNHTKNYKKTYWPYLPMLLIVGLGFGLNTLWTGTSAVLGASNNFSASSMLDSTNQQRASSGEAPLTIDNQLAQAAQSKANDMAKHNYWSHNSPQGKTPWTFIGASGYQYQAAGENLAFGFSGGSDVITGWMNSQEHRDNILNPVYQNVGFGVAQAPNYQGKGPQTIVVAEYGQPVPAVANITFTVPEPSHTAPTVLSATELKANNVARIQMLTGGKAAWSALAVAALAGAALAVFIVRHGVRLKKLLVEGEAFVVHHPALDTTVVVIIVAGALLLQHSGTIR